MSPPPPEQVPAPAGEAPDPKASPMFKNCWSCRMLSGGALLLSGAYVYHAARRVMRHGAPTTVGTVAQITFAASLAAWGVVLIADPVGKAQKKT